MTAAAKRDPELEMRVRLATDFEFYAKHCLHIRPKAGGLIPFVLNNVQRIIHRKLEDQRSRKGRVRALILKARQPGCSTYIGGRFYWRVSQRHGVRAFIMTHRDSSTDQLFNMVKRFHDNVPPDVKPLTGKSNIRELSFKLMDSGYGVGTAKAVGVARGETIQYFHGSEVAFWQKAEEHAGGALEAVPKIDGTEIVLESTANGVGGTFYHMVIDAMAGKSDFEVIFIPWFWHEEYRLTAPMNWSPGGEWLEYAVTYDLELDQLYWAYEKNAEMAAKAGQPADQIYWRFRQEYPATAHDAFQIGDVERLIHPDPVMRALKAEFPEPSEEVPLVLGIDVARGGKDKTRMLDRHGRRYGYNCNLIMDTNNLMEIANRAARVIDDIQPDRVFVDATGGYGSAVKDRLHEMGYEKLVQGIEFGGTAEDPDNYVNKRSEIWVRLRDILNEPGGCDINDAPPEGRDDDKDEDDQEIALHLCGPSYSHDSLGRIQLEKKEKIKERLGFSPDYGDAAALTHSGPVRKKPRSTNLPEQTQSDYDEHHQ